jgi:hypothetical protein
MASNRHVILASHIVIQQLTRRTWKIGNFHFLKAPSGWAGKHPGGRVPVRCKLALLELGAF